MKKSLFKRAISAAVSVPLALTQCVLPAIAAEPAVNASASNNATDITIGTFTDVDVESTPDFNGATGVYTQESTWYKTVNTAFMSLENDVVFDVEQEQLDSMFAKVIDKAGSYAKEVEMILNNIKDVKATANSEGKIVVTAKLMDISSSIEELCEEEVNKAIDEIKAKYDGQYTGELDDFAFECPAIEGTLTATVDMSEVATSKGGKVTYELSNADGTFKGIDAIVDYVNDKFEEIKGEINKEVNKLLADAKGKLDEAQKQVDGAQLELNKANDKLAEAKDEVLAKEAEIADAEAEVAELEEEIKNAPAGADTTEAEKKLKDAKNKIADAQDKIAEVKNQIADYEKQAEKAQKDLDTAKETLAAAKTDFEKAGGTASEKVDAYFAGFESKIDEILEKIDELKSESKTFKGKDVNEVLAQIADTKTDKELLNKLIAKMPASIEVVKNNATANAYFDKAVNKANEILADTDYAVAVTLADACEFAEGLSNVVVSYESGVATFTATFEDDQYDELVKEYENTLAITSSVKKIEATIDIEAMYKGDGEFKINSITREFTANAVTTTTTPATTTEEVVTTTAEPGTTTEEVVTTTVEPGTTTEEVVTTTAEPGTTTEEVVTTTAEPGTTTEEVVTTTAEPGTTTGDIVTTTAEPGTTTGDIVTTTAEPGTTTAESGTTTEEVVTTTAEPGTTTGDVITTTVQPGTTGPIVTQEFDFNDCYIDTQNGVDGFEATEGYYFSHDTNSFNKDQIKKLVVTVITKNGQKIQGVNLLDEADMDTKLGTGNRIIPSFGTQTPKSVFAADKGNKYAVNVYVGSGEKMIELSDENVNPFTVDAYIGVKGDVTLDNDVNSLDASRVLSYYTNTSINVSGANIEMFPGKNDDQFIENLVCFLGDINEDEYSADNWKKIEADRTLNASDASWILAYYAQTSIGKPKDITTWNLVLGK